MAPSLAHPQISPHLVRTHKLLVLVDDGTAETALEDDDGREHEAGADFHEAQLGLVFWYCLLFLLLLLALLLFFSPGSSLAVVVCILFPRVRLGHIGLPDLEAADPDLAVGESEAHHVVDEWFDFSGVGRHAKDVGEEVLDQEEGRGGGEGAVEGEEGPGALEAVAGEVEFGCCVYYPYSESAAGSFGQMGMREPRCGPRGGIGNGRVESLTILQMHLHGRAIRRFAHPHI